MKEKREKNNAKRNLAERDRVKFIDIRSRNHRAFNMG